MAIDSQELDNMVRYQKGMSSFYEVYYLKFPIPESSYALWLRYTLLSPKRSLGSTTAAVWAIFYHRGEPQQNFALKDVVAIEETVIDRDIFYFQVKESAIYNNGARGEIISPNHRLRWDLQFVPQEESFKIYPPYFYYLPFPKTKFISPNWSVQISGEVEVDGRKIHVRNAPGSQGHLWGTSYAERWAWAHCNAFVDESYAVVEALTGQVRIGKKPLRPMTAFALRTPGGKLLCFNRLSQLFFTRSQYNWEGWELQGQSGHYRARMRFVNRPAEMVGVTYTDTDGSPLYCYHSEFADVEVDLLEQQKGQWKSILQLHAKETGAFEVIERAPNPNLPLLL